MQALLFRRDFTPFEFAYWLQGAIEIGALRAFTPLQAARIKRRLEDVAGFREGLATMLGDITEHDLATRAVDDARVAGLRARREALPPDMNYPIHVWLALTLMTGADAFAVIDAVQQRLFIHDIDPSYPGDQDYFHRVHGGLAEPDDERPANGVEVQGAPGGHRAA